MRNLLKNAFIATALLGTVAVLSGTAHAQTAYAIANGGTTLVSFNVNTPGTILSSVNFSGAGFPANFATLDAIDFRPSNGLLYGYLDSTDTLYTVNTTTGALTSVAAGIAGTTNTNILDIDFNPSIDRLRVVTNGNENTVINPNDGTVTPATALSYATGDPNFNTAPRINGNAYAGNVAGSGFGFTQYAIDYGTDQLVTLANNTGVLTTVGNLGTNTGEYTGFDIFTSLTGVNSAYAILDGTVGGTNPSLYSINLGTGAATKIGSGIGGLTGVYSLAIRPAIVPEAGTLPLLLGTGISMLGFVAVRRRIKK